MASNLATHLLLNLRFNRTLIHEIAIQVLMFQISTGKIIKGNFGVCFLVRMTTVLQKMQPNAYSDNSPCYQEYKQLVRQSK